MPSRVILLVGCAGSGKSTYARSHFLGAKIVSSDHFFERMAIATNRTYRQVFDVQLLRDSHKQCELEFQVALEKGTPLVIVDNTNVHPADRQRYIKSAAGLGCETELHVFSPWIYGTPCLSPRQIQDYVDLCHGRSTHAVPFETVAQQFSKLDLASGIYLAGKPPEYLFPMPSQGH